MACGCTFSVSHLLVSPYRPWSTVQQQTRRALWAKPNSLRSSLRNSSVHYERTVVLRRTDVQCSSSSPSKRESPSPSIDVNSEAGSNQQTGPDVVPMSYEEIVNEFRQRMISIAGCLLAVLLSYGLCTKAAYAVAESSIAASGFGFRVAAFLRRSGLPDELVVLATATLPVVELRGAIPISYWLQVAPLKGFILAVIGNMIPVPIIYLYLKNLSEYLGERSTTAKSFFTWLFEKTRKKGGVIEEFQWLGLMLFVAVPFPGTGAWTGAIVSSILDMPFWDAITANFCGVVLAGFLVNLLVTSGLRNAVIGAAALFTMSTFMWNVLRKILKKKDHV